MNLRTILVDDTRPAFGHVTDRVLNSCILAGMFLGMALIYRTVSLPWIGVGLVIFGLLALLRPALGLLFVPLTAPWYLSPVYFPDIRAAGTVLPLAEVLLLVVFAAVVARTVFSFPRVTFGLQRLALIPLLPHVLFLLAGVIGVAIAIERAPALRDFRWMVVEPLIFYGLMRWFQRRDQAYSVLMAQVLVVSGIFVAVMGLLQLVGVNLVSVLLSPTKSYADEIVLTNGLYRVTSVYGHPNNLGLFLGRVWPIALVLGLAAFRGQGEPGRRWRALVYAVGTLLCLAGIAVSLSRGAWLGVAAAIAVLLLGFTVSRTSTRNAASPSAMIGRWALVAALFLVVGALGGLVISLRGGIGGGSTDVRLLFWQESLKLIARQPLGLGLDQYYYYHNPEFGRNLIDPAAMEQSEWYARHPHNLVFELWLLLTPFGLAAFVWLLARFIRRGVAAIRAGGAGGLLALGALAAMAAAITHGLVDSFYFWPDLAFTFWLLIALVDAVKEP